MYVPGNGILESLIFLSPGTHGSGQAGLQMWLMKQRGHCLLLTRQSGWRGEQTTVAGPFWRDKKDRFLPGEAILLLLDFSKPKQPIPKTFEILANHNKQMAENKIGRFLYHLLVLVGLACFCQKHNNQPMPKYSKPYQTTSNRWQYKKERASVP